MHDRVVVVRFVWKIRYKKSISISSHTA
jgi:hypothetical protein